MSSNNINTNNLTTPRTVKQVRALDNEIAKCDKLLDRATLRGNLEASIRYDAMLKELTDAMSAVSDLLWGRYCETLLIETEEA